MPKIHIKPGVRFDLIAPAGARILEILKYVVAHLDHDITITSGTDGKHSGPKDPHKTGEAYDLRTRGLTPLQISRMLKDIKTKLGPRFFAFHEAVGTSHAHIHVQRKRGTTYSMEDYLGNA